MINKTEWIEERIAILIHDAHIEEEAAKIRAVELYDEHIARQENRNYELKL
ncbi:hypothetical protein KAR91_16725 [Candidatus Pacearchaeota archaeon]|nr:hypothetical protein [Candidatus Pacearchaeota archaeon]